MPRKCNGDGLAKYVVLFYVMEYIVLFYMDEYVKKSRFELYLFATLMTAEACSAKKYVRSFLIHTTTFIKLTKISSWSKRYSVRWAEGPLFNWTIACS